MFPEIVLPSTVPLNSSVIDIGSMMLSFQETAFPLTVPSKMSVLLPSALCVPCSALPAVVTASVALRSPIGVCIVRFQVPSAAMAHSSKGVSWSHLNEGRSVKSSARHGYSGPAANPYIPTLEDGLDRDTRALRLFDRGAAFVPDSMS